ILQAAQIIEDVREVVDRKYDGADRLVLKGLKSDKKMRLADIDDVLTNPIGSYAYGRDIPRLSTFDQDFSHIDASIRERLWACDFAVDIRSSNEDHIEILDGVVICAEEMGLLACSTIDGHYVR